jgi:serine/threonine protein kinase
MRMVSALAGKYFKDLNDLVRLPLCGLLVGAIGAQGFTHMDLDQTIAERTGKQTSTLPVEEKEYVHTPSGSTESLIVLVQRILSAQKDLPSDLMDISPEERAMRLSQVLETGNQLLVEKLAALKPETPGVWIGNYKLVKELGRGGFGTVWLAEQVYPVRRVVALKILRLGMDTTDVLARFDQERQALALMTHPHIAKMFDAGATPTGRPFFVMEHVDGVSITEFCDLRRMSIPDRLTLFISVCNAVHHAHEHGVIHRDIKPANILVALQDGRPAAKVIDFGVAKATKGRLTDLTLITQVESTVGTPLYMSPEQTLSSRVEIDHRTDVYSLGVLLFELLAGILPLDPASLMQSGVDDIHKAIRETELEKPSAVVSRLAADRLAAVAKNRSCTPARLIRTLRGDLDWIVMKALESDRNRRYATAQAFGNDLERHLRSEAIVARRPSATYRLGRFVHRNRTALATFSCALALSLSLLFMLLAIGAPGYVAITSEPAGAEVWSGKERIGVTPLTLRRHKPGQVAYSVRAPGYDDCNLLAVVEPHRTLVLHAPLRLVSLNRPSPAGSFTPLWDADLRHTLPTPLATVLTVESAVDIRDVNGRRVKAYAGMKLYTGDYVETGKHSHATLALADGSTMRINELTTLTIKSARPGEVPQSVDITQGSVYFFSDGSREKLRIKTPAAVGEISG